MRQFCQIIVVLWLLATGVDAGAERPSLFGFAPAYPADSLSVFTPAGGSAYTLFERHVVMLLEVDGEGKVLKVSGEGEGQERFVGYVREHLLGLTLEPAEFEGEKVASVLPVVVAFEPKRRVPEFRFPVDMEREVTDRDRYFGVFGYNDIVLPKVTRFPSYFAEMDWADSMALYPFVVLKLAIDTAGGVTAIDTVVSTYPSRTMTTASASLWADFEPAVVRGKKVAAECFLVVSYYPQVSYPTKVWTAEAADTLGPHERWRVQSLADTVGLMAVPIPRRAPGNQINLRGDHWVGASDTISIWLTVDRFGQMGARRVYSRDASVGLAVRRLSGKIPFYPALDYGGVSESFGGLVYLSGGFSANVRIYYVW